MKAAAELEEQSEAVLHGLAKGAEVSGGERAPKMRFRYQVELE